MSTPEKETKSIGSKIAKGLGAVAKGFGEYLDRVQAVREEAVLAHVRGERHNEVYCELCRAKQELRDSMPERNFPLKECTKHAFGECKANCRYRTGVLEPCTLHTSDSCAANCGWRK